VERHNLEQQVKELQEQVQELQEHRKADKRKIARLKEFLKGKEESFWRR